MALTTGFMCIVACDCNQKAQPMLEKLSIDAGHAQFARDNLCELIPWGEVDFSLIENSNVEELAELAYPITDRLCGCNSY